MKLTTEEMYNIIVSRTGEDSMQIYNRLIEQEYQRLIDNDMAKKRFWSKVNKNGPTMPHMDSSCWVWMATKHSLPRTYGLFQLNGTTKRAHRVSWEFVNQRPIPNGLFVCHTCDNPPCVNPDHLFLGTNLANSQDRMIKGRTVVPKGESSHLAKLTWEIVKEIRYKFANTKTNYRKLAREYNMHPATIRQIILKLTWKT